MTAPAPIRVVLADDHALVLEGLRNLLAAEPGVEILATATDGAEALDAAIEMNLFTAFGASVGNKPVEERFAVAARAVGFIGDEVVYVEKAAPGEILQHAEAGHGHDHPSCGERGELEAIGLLAACWERDAPGGTGRQHGDEDGQTRAGDLAADVDRRDGLQRARGGDHLGQITVCDRRGCIVR